MRFKEDDNGEIYDVVPLDKGVRAKKYTDDDKVEILNLIANGATLTSILAQPDRPNIKTFYKWVMDDKDFALQYKKARKIQAMVWADQVIAIADDTEHDNDIDGDGKPIWNYEHIQRTKLRINVRQWAIRAALPEIYGEKALAAPAEKEVSKMVDGPPQESREDWMKRQREKLALPEVIKKDEEDG